MGFHKHCTNPDGQGRTRKNGNEFTLTARYLALPTGLLDLMGRIVHHRTTGLGENGQGPHV